MQDQQSEGMTGYSKNLWWRLSRTWRIVLGVGALVLVLGACATGAQDSGSNGGAPQANAKSQLTPTPTPKPKTWRTIYHTSGNGTGLTTPTFTAASDNWRIVWACQAADQFGGGSFSIELDGSDGSYVDLVANTSGNDGQTTYEHQGGSYYLKIDTYSETWTVSVQVYE